MHYLWCSSCDGVSDFNDSLASVHKWITWKTQISFYLRIYLREIIVLVSINASSCLFFVFSKCFFPFFVFVVPCRFRLPFLSPFLLLFFYPFAFCVLISSSLLKLTWKKRISQKREALKTLSGEPLIEKIRREKKIK